MSSLLKNSIKTGTNAFSDLSLGKEKKNNGNTFTYLAEKTGLGVVSWAEGVADFVVGGLADLFGADDYAEEVFANDWVDYDHADSWFNPDTLTKVAGDTATGIGNSIPGIAISVGTAIATSGASLAVQTGVSAAGTFLSSGLSAAGQSTKEAYQKTGKLGTAEWAYGIGSGVIEGATETLTDVALSKVGLSAKGLISKTAVGKNLVKSLTKETLGKTVAASFASEALEEGISGVLTPLLEKATISKDSDLTDLYDAGDIGYAMLVGGLSGALMGGFSYAGASAVNLTKGAKISSNQEKLNSTMAFAKTVRENNEKLGLETEAIEQYNSLYDSLVSSMEKTDNKPVTVTQKAKLGELNTMAVNATLSSATVRNAYKIVNNAEAFADTINSLYVGSDGKSTMNVTAEALTEGVVFGKGKESVRSLVNALKTNETLRTVAIAQTANTLILDSSAYSNTVLNGEATESTLNRDNINRFLERTDDTAVKERNAVQRALNIDLSTATDEEIQTAYQTYIQNGGKETIQKSNEAKKTFESLSDTKAKTEIGTGIRTTDGTTKYNVNGYNFAVMKSGESYYMYDYDSKTISKALNRAEMVQTVQKIKADTKTNTETNAENIVQSTTMEYGTTEQAKASETRIDAIARKAVSNYSEMAESDKVNVRATVRAVQNSNYTEEEVARFAQITAKTGLKIQLSDKETLEGRANAKYDADTVYIPKNYSMDKTADAVMAHEVFHNLFANATEKEQVKLLNEALVKMDSEKANEIFEQYKKHYEGKGISAVELSEIVGEEIAANYAEEVLGSEKGWEYLLSEARVEDSEDIVTLVKRAIRRNADAKELSKAGRKFLRTYDSLLRGAVGRNEMAKAKGNGENLRTKDGTAIVPTSSSEARKAGVGGIHDNGKWSLKQMDEEYLELAKDPEKNKARLQEMVAEAAFSKGYDTLLYHGTPGLSSTKIDTKYSDDGISFFTSDDLDVTSWYAFTDEQKDIGKDIKANGNNNYAFYVKTNGMYVIEGNKSQWDNISDAYILKNPNDLLQEYPDEGYEIEDYDDYIEIRKGRYSGTYYWNDEESQYEFGDGTDVLPEKEGGFGDGSTREISERVYDSGKYRGVIFKNIYDSGFGDHLANIYNIFYPQQDAKSADAVTYDDNGNIIPLSDRFNPENEDIRWSLKNNDIKRRAESTEYFDGNDYKKVYGTDPYKSTHADDLKIIDEEIVKILRSSGEAIVSAEEAIKIAMSLDGKVSKLGWIEAQLFNPEGLTINELKVLKELGAGISDSRIRRFEYSVKTGKDDMTVWKKKNATDVIQSKTNAKFVKSLYHELRTDGSLDAFADKVFDACDKLGVSFRFLNYTKSGKNIGGDAGYDVTYNTYYFQSNAIKDSIKADFLLHESIHAVTNYWLKLDEKGLLRSSDASEAVETIKDCYAYAKRTGGEILTGFYGISDKYEFVAELCNFTFRDFLAELNDGAVLKELESSVAFLAENASAETYDFAKKHIKYKESSYYPKYEEIIESDEPFKMEGRDRIIKELREQLGKAGTENAAEQLNALREEIETREKTIQELKEKIKKSGTEPKAEMRELQRTVTELNLLKESTEKQIAELKQENANLKRKATQKTHEAEKAKEETRKAKADTKIAEQKAIDSEKTAKAATEEANAVRARQDLIDKYMKRYEKWLEKAGLSFHVDTLTGHGTVSANLAADDTWKPLAVKLATLLNKTSHAYSGNGATRLEAELTQFVSQLVGKIDINDRQVGSLGYLDENGEPLESLGFLDSFVPGYYIDDKTGEFIDEEEAVKRSATRYQEKADSPANQKFKAFMDEQQALIDRMFPEETDENGNKVRPDGWRDIKAEWNEACALILADTYVNKKGKTMPSHAWTEEKYMAANVIIGDIVNLYRNYDMMEYKGKRVKISETAKEYIEKYKETIKRRNGKTTADEKNEHKLIHKIKSYQSHVSTPMVRGKIADRFVKDGFFTDQAEILSKASARRDGMVARVQKEVEAKVKELGGRDFLRSLKERTIKVHADPISRTNPSGQEVNFAGGTFEIPVGQLMDMLAMNTQKENGGQTITAQDGGGIVFRDKNGNIIKDANGEQALHFSPTEIKNIKAQLTENEQKFYDFLYKKMNDTVSKWKYDTDMEMFGYSNNLSDGNYWRLNRYRQNFKAESVSDPYQQKNNGMFNSRRKNAYKTSLEATDMLDKFMSQMKQTAKYAALSLDVQNYNKLLNFNTEAVHELSRKSLATEITENDKESFDYMEKLLSDISGLNKEVDNSFVSSLRSGYVQATFGLNIKMSVGQFASYMTANPYIDVKYLRKAMAYKCDYDMMDECSDTAIVRNYKMMVAAESVTNKDGNANGKLTHVKEAVGDALEKVQWAGKVDRFTIGKLWVASQLQTEAESEGKLKYGTEECAKASVSRFEEAVVKTQPTYDVANKSEMQRSNEPSDKVFSVFKSVQTKQISMLIDGIGEAIYNKDKKLLGKVINALLTTSVFYALICQLWRTFRGQTDEDDNNGKNWFVQYLQQSLNALIGCAPIISDIEESIISGYDIEEVGLSYLSELTSVASTGGDILFGAVKGDLNERTARKWAKKLIQTVGSGAGVPVTNAWNLIDGIIRTASPSAGYTVDNFYYTQSYASDYQKALSKGDTKLADTIFDLMMQEKTAGTFGESQTSEMERLYEAGYTTVLPTAISTKISYTDESGETVSVTLTNKQKKQFAKVYDGANDVIAEMIETDAYASLSDEAKAKAIDKVYDIYLARAKAEVTDGLYQSDSTAETLSIAMDEGTLAVYLSAISEFTSDKDEDGSTINGSKRQKVSNYLRKQKSLSNGEKLMLLTASGYTIKNNDILGKTADQCKNILLKYILSLNVTADEKAQLAEQCGFTVKDGKILTSTSTSTSSTTSSSSKTSSALVKKLF